MGVAGPQPPIDYRYQIKLSQDGKNGVVKWDVKADVVGHVDFKNHGPGAPSGHGHTFPQPGNPASGHGPGNPHIPNNQLPPGWDA